MNKFSVEVLENGFAIIEDDGRGGGSRKWVFESHENLAKFILSWGALKTFEEYKEPKDGT